MMARRTKIIEQTLRGKLSSEIIYVTPEKIEELKKYVDSYLTRLMLSESDPYETVSDKPSFIQRRTIKEAYDSCMERLREPRIDEEAYYWILYDIEHLRIQADMLPTLLEYAKRAQEKMQEKYFSKRTELKVKFRFNHVAKKFSEFVNVHTYSHKNGSKRVYKTDVVLSPKKVIHICVHENDHQAVICHLFYVDLIDHYHFIDDIKFRCQHKRIQCKL